MDTKKLRQKILDLAIRGKLVPQDPNDEPASVLLERIRAEKERLIKEGKIKRSKKTATDDELEAPFEIPESWEWVRLEVFLLLLSGQDFPPSKYNSDSKGLPYIIGASNIENEKLLVNRWTETPSVVSKLNDVLVVCKGAGVGKIAMNDVGDVHIARQIQAIRDETGIINSKYIKLCIASNISSIILNANGLIPGLKRELLLSLMVPIAPIAEQERIVSAVEHLYSYIDSLESNEGDLLKAIEQAKSKILDLAIHGKLVPQDPNDEPAIDLLKRINPKFEACDEEKSPFIIPKSWEWTTIGEIASSILYGVSESAKETGNYKLLRITDIQNNTVNWETVPFTDYDDKKVLSYILQDGDILFARTGATVGKSYLVEGLLQPSIYASYLIRLRTTNMILPIYIKKYFESRYYWEQITMSSVGIGQPNVNGTILGGLFIPIPPYQEQLRIVAKIEELFTVLDSIKASLE